MATQITAVRAETNYYNIVFLKKSAIFSQKIINGSHQKIDHNIDPMNGDDVESIVSIHEVSFKYVMMLESHTFL
jgi:hypothetical protein